MADDVDPGESRKSKKKRRAEEAGAAEPFVATSSPAKSAGLASCLTAIILTLLVLGTVLYVTVIDPSILPPSLTWGPWRIAAVILLLLVIPVVVFRAVTLWIMGEGPRFVDIEFSWRAGIDAMAKQGITLKSAPLFLVIGAGSDKLRENLMAAAGIAFRVDGVPAGPAPMHWYASDDAIYLFLDDACWMNLVGRQYRAAQRSGRARPGGDAPPDQGAGRRAAPIISTLMPGAAHEPTRASTQTLSGTMPPGDQEPSLASPPRGPAPGRAAYLGTLSPDHVSPVDAGPKAGGRPAAPARVTRRAPSQESSEQLRRLEAVAAKLRRHRQPVCPLNGILVLLPFDLLQASRADIEEVERALSADLLSTRRELQLRCPVTALVVAMEQERGFCELIRRIGKEHSARQRFGLRFDLRRQPTVEQLQRFSVCVCGVFEDWVYNLFKDHKVLSHPGNPSLYNLLCKVRRSFQARLSDVLSKGFGVDPQAELEPHLFSGCYFAATGSAPERQAFVSGVLSKLKEEQEDLDWTVDALVADSRRRRAAVAGWVLAGLLGVGLALLVVFG